LTEHALSGEFEHQYASRHSVLVSANPKSGSRNRMALIHELQAKLKQLGFDCELHTNLQQISERAYELDSQDKLRTVVAAGGDGTAATVASLIPSEVPLTLFPTGSENLLAQHLDVKPSPNLIADAIQQMASKRMDAMEVNGKLTLLMASIGFDADVVRRVHLDRRSHVTRWTYRLAILRSLLSYRWGDIRVNILDSQGDVQRTHIGSWVFVFNIPRYAAGLQIVPDAVDNDGMLDIGIFGPGGVFAGIRNYLSVLRGTHVKQRNWARIKADSISIHTTKAETGSSTPSCQTDGDWASHLPVAIRVLPNRLTLVRP
jgi:diacylglycerol kinase (ATP)